MARIRTVKPDFFRHEGLQDLEAAHPKLKPMLVFAGLWGHCDKEGRFEWRPRQLKLDILPFLDFDMNETLYALEQGGFIIRYEVQGKHYGIVPTFGDHQRISGKEAQEEAKHPPLPKVKTKKQVGSDGEANEQRERPSGNIPVSLGREGKGVQEEEGNTGSAPEVAPREENVSRETRKRGTRLEDDWRPSDADLAYARSLGWDDARTERERVAIIRWSKSSPKNGVKLDWSATWRNWVDRVNGEKPANPTADRAKSRRAAIAAGMGDKFPGGEIGPGIVGGDEASHGFGTGPIIEGFAEPGETISSGEPASLCAGDGETPGLGGDVRPADEGRSNGDRVLSGVVGRSAGGFADGSDQTDHREPPVPYAAEAGGYSEARVGGLRETESNVDARESGAEVREIVDPFEIPAALRRFA